MTTRKRVVEAARKQPRVELRSIVVTIEEDPDPDASYLDQDEFEDRLAAYKRGDFGFVGMRAQAEVAVEGILQTLTSGGLWGIESDSGEEYMLEVANEEYQELRKILKTVGVSTDQLPAQAERDWIEWRV